MQDVTHSTLNTTTSYQLFDRAVKLIPGGVNSPVRAMKSVKRTHPIFIKRGAGSKVWDVDGNAYIDWVQSWGALPFGHADAEIVEAVEKALQDGSTFGAPTEREVELAELVCSSVPSIESVRFTSSGTEATMSAIRVARAATGRNIIITFSGCYHGHADPFLATGGSGMATLSIPSSPGVPSAVTETTLIARYNDLESVEALINEAGADSIAAIIVEPVAANMGVVEPKPGFLQGLRMVCDRIGALLIFDEVITGFRVSMGGAQELFGINPDLSTFGKIIGGGLPVGAFGGKRELMQQLAPAGSVYQAGTLSGNPLAMAAGIATLTALRERNAFATLDAKGAELAGAFQRAIDSGFERCAVSRVGSLVTLFHIGNQLPGAPENFDDAKQLDTEDFARTHAIALESGHMLPASQFEALFVSTAHTEDQIEALANTVAASMSQPDGVVV